MKKITTKFIKFFLTISLLSIFASCSKNSQTTNSSENQNLSNPTDSDPVAPPVDNPSNLEYKIYANSINEMTGIFDLGGQVVNANIDSNKLNLITDVYISAQSNYYLAAKKLLDYPEIKSSLISDGAGRKILRLKTTMIYSKSAHLEWQKIKNEPKSPAPPVVVNPPVANITIYQGQFSGPYAGIATLAVEGNQFYGEYNDMRIVGEISADGSIKGAMYVSGDETIELKGTLSAGTMSGIWNIYNHNGLDDGSFSLQKKSTVVSSPFPKFGSNKNGIKYTGTMFGPFAGNFSIIVDQKSLFASEYIASNGQIVRIIGSIRPDNKVKATIYVPGHSIAEIEAELSGNNISGLINIHNDNGEYEGSIELQRTN